MPVSTTTIAAKREWKAYDRPSDTAVGKVLDEGNGTTNFGLVQAGTMMGALSSGKVRPCAMDEIATGGSSVNTATVTDSANFFVGDTVDVIAGAARATAIVAGDNPSNLTVTPAKTGISVDIVVGTAPKDLTHSFTASTGVIQISAAVPVNATVIAAGDNPSNLTVTPRYKAFILDIVVAGNGTSFSSTIDAATDTITINSATDGGGAATTTVGDIAAELEGKFGALVTSAVAETAADLVVDVGPTNITYTGNTTTTTTGDLAGILLGTYGGLISAAVAETAADLVVDVGPTALVYTGDVIADDRTVSANASNVLTLSGAAFTTAVGDIVRVTDGWQPCGILESYVNTKDFTTGAEAGVERIVNVAIDGYATESRIIGAGTTNKRLMAGGVVSLPALSASPITSLVKGFLFL